MQRYNVSISHPKISEESMRASGEQGPPMLTLSGLHSGRLPYRAASRISHNPQYNSIMPCHMACHATKTVTNTLCIWNPTNIDKVFFFFLCVSTGRIRIWQVFFWWQPIHPIFLSQEPRTFSPNEGHANLIEKFKGLVHLISKKLPMQMPTCL